MVFQEFNATSHPIVRLEADWNDHLRSAHEKTAAFIIRKNGSYIEAIKGGTATGAGTVVYGGALNLGGALGTNASIVIGAAVAASSHEQVYIKGATYTCPTAIGLIDDVEVAGEMYNTVLSTNGAVRVFYGVGLDRVVLKNLTVANFVTTAGSAGIYLEDCTFTELQNIRSYLGQTGVYIKGVAVDSSVYCDNVYCTLQEYGIIVEGKVDEVRLAKTRVFSCSIQGIAVQNTSDGVVHLIHPDIQCPNAAYGLYIYEADNLGVKVEGGGVYGYEDVGMVISTSSALVSIHDFDVYTSNHQGVIVYSTNRVLLDGVQVENCSYAHHGTYAGLEIDGGSQYTRVTNCTILGAFHSFDIYEHGASDFMWVVNNRFYTISYPIGGNDYVRYNQDYITNSSGTGSGTSPITCAHHFSGGNVPTRVAVTAYGTTPLKTSWTSDATNIYIYHDAVGSADVSYIAEYTQ